MESVVVGGHPRGLALQDQIVNRFQTLNEKVERMGGLAPDDSRTVVNKDD